MKLSSPYWYWYWLLVLINAAAVLHGGILSIPSMSDQPLKTRFGVKHVKYGTRVKHREKKFAIVSKMRNVTNH